MEKKNELKRWFVDVKKISAEGLRQRTNVGYLVFEGRLGGWGTQDLIEFPLESRRALYLYSNILLLFETAYLLTRAIGEMWNRPTPSRSVLFWGFSWIENSTKCCSIIDDRRIVGEKTAQRETLCVDAAEWSRPAEIIDCIAIPHVFIREKWGSA